MFRILCVEDTKEVQMLVQKTLAPEHEVIIAGTLQSAREELKSGKFNLILLDIHLPDGDGIRFCSELKSSPDTLTIPVIILTANNSIYEKKLGFQLGIEDFIVKPFDPVELRVRIESRLKKIAEHTGSLEILSLGSLRINYGSQRVAIHTADGDFLPVELSSTEFKILNYLARNFDQVKSREQIITAVWGDAMHLSDRTIDSHISRMRKKLAQSNCIIEAIANSGYRFSLASKTKRAA